MFPLLEEAERKRGQEPFLVEYSITTKGWKATGAIKYDPAEEQTFWSLLQMVVESVMEGGQNTAVINESFTSGFSRYLAPVDLK